jgi:hypothetical protein
MPWVFNRSSIPCLPTRESAQVPSVSEVIATFKDGEHQKKKVRAISKLRESMFSKAKLKYSYLSI